MVIVMALVMVVNKKATFQDDYQCCGDDDGDDVDVFKNRRSDGERHGNGDADGMMVVNKEGGLKGGLCRHHQLGDVEDDVGDNVFIKDYIDGCIVQ